MCSKLTLCLLLCAPLGAFAAVFHVNPETGSDTADGSAKAPFKTIARALKDVDGPGGDILLDPVAGGYRESAVIRKGGTPESPLVLDGQGAVINGGRDVSAGPWTQVEDGFRLEQPVPKHTRPWTTSPFFVNGLPMFVDHPQGKGRPAWHGGALRYDEEGRAILRFPTGLNPNNAVVVVTAADQVCGIHCAGGGNIVIKNITVALFGNDGFNFHNNCHDLVLDHVKAIFNGDQGISSHETCVVEVRDSEVAFNGTMSGGIADINFSVTTYKNVTVHHNRNDGFYLVGKQHSLIGVQSYGNIGTNFPKPSDKIVFQDTQDGVTTAADRGRYR